MKEIRRDFTAVVDVPDDAAVEDVEILATITASYARQLLDPSVIAEDPYEAEPELPEPPEPKCPECGANIEYLSGVYPALVPARACIVDGKLYTDYFDGVKVSDVITDDDVETWHCPHCDEVLFRGDKVDEIEDFLKGGNQ